MSRPKKRILWTLVFLVLLGLDAFVKYYVFHFLPKMSLQTSYPYGGIGVFQAFSFSFSLVHVANQGAAWGILADFPNFLWYLRLFIIGFLLIYLVFRHISQMKFLALSLVLTGAIGNLFDRFFYGAVIDMFYLQLGTHSYPVFNFADSYITLGIIWFLLVSLQEEKKDAA